MDIFDGFEMKPLTKGLGFHKKVTDLKSNMDKGDLGSKKLQHNIPELPVDEMFTEEGPAKDISYEDLLSALDNPSKGFEINEPLGATPKPGARLEISDLAKDSFNAGADFFKPEVDIQQPFPGEEAPAPSKIETPFNTKMPAIIEREEKKNSSTSRGATNSPGGLLKPASFSLMAAMLDILLSVGLSMLSMVLLVMITGAQLESVFTTAKFDTTIQLAFLVMYVSIYQIYVIGSRSMAGQTLGEWTFGFQLGRDEDQEKAMYPMRVLLRGIIIVLTGVVTLPLLSIIFQSDLLKHLTGVELYCQNDMNS